MLLNFIIAIVSHVINFIFSLLPVATIKDIPIIGVFMYDFLLNMVETFNAFFVTFPYAIELWNVFIYVMIPFELAVLLIKFILGARTPIAHH